MSMLNAKCQSIFYLTEKSLNRSLSLSGIFVFFFFNNFRIPIEFCVCSDMSVQFKFFNCLSPESLRYLQLAHTLIVEMPSKSSRIIHTVRQQSKLYRKGCSNKCAGLCLTSNSIELNRTRNIRNRKQQANKYANIIRIAQPAQSPAQDAYEHVHILVWKEALDNNIYCLHNSYR